MSRSPQDAWAQLRFAVVGQLLQVPPKPGELKQALRDLSDREWQHPVTKNPLRFAFSTVERWYYLAVRSTSPFVALRTKPRRDRGHKPSLPPALQELLEAQYRAYPHFSYRLHHDNLAARLANEPALGPLPSYTSVRRFFEARGLVRTRRKNTLGRPGMARAQERLDRREVRSYEHDHVGALWHLDFHTSRFISVLRSDGEWVKPELLGVLDDCSRLCCHAQWYFTEDAQTLAHGLCQAFLKRGLPRGVLMDNGPAETAAEIATGLERLGIAHHFTLPYSAYQNGKQEHFWAVVEGRLMAMLDRHDALTLAQLNLYTQAWVERDYHQNVHSEIGSTPLDRYRNGPDLSRTAPSPEVLRDTFVQRVTRTVRRSDGTFSLGAVRFEVPNRFRHFRKVTVDYAQWDLSRAFLVDPRTHVILARVFPQDRQRNSDGMRRTLEEPTAVDLAPNRTLPPLLDKLVAEYAATGVPPAFLVPEHERD